MPNSIPHQRADLLGGSPTRFGFGVLGTLKINTPSNLQSIYEN